MNFNEETMQQWEVSGIPTQVDEVVKPIY